MTQKLRTSLYATAAISAALAFGSTPLLAQEAAAPAIQLPPAAAPGPVAPTPQPKIVLPDPPAPAAEAPAAERPAPRAERPAPRAERNIPRSAPQPAPEPASAPVAVVPVAAGPAVLQPPVDTPPAADPAPVADGRQQDSVSSSVDMPDEMLAAIGIGIAALGGIGIAGMMRRRRRQAEPENAVYEPEPQYVAEAPITSIPEELEVGDPQYATYSPVHAQERQFAMPAGPVPTGEARRQLLDEMVAAAPDEANPFTSARARRKRARIILQSRERAQHQDATQPFDWRTYRAPTADPATPPMVDA